MTGRLLSRAEGDARAAAPVRLVHLGLGGFFRAHQAWYTEHASDAASWGYAAFSGRGSDLARTLEAQDGLYTLVERGPEEDSSEVVASLSEAFSGTDHGRWLERLASHRVAVVTATVTEAGYCQARGGGLDTARPDVAEDVSRLRSDVSSPVATPPARLVAGLAARRRADAGPLALVPCDNLPGNGEIARRVVVDLAELLDPALAEWIEGSVRVVTTVVDRITPRVGPASGLEGRAGRGRDESPVVTEPFSEWVLSGEFPAGRPSWEDGGALFVEDVAEFERRKLWLVNGAHSLLAYAGSVLGLRTVAEAMADDRCVRWVEQWWATACPHLSQPAHELASYTDALVKRLANVRMNDELSRIAEDGSQKLPLRILPVLRAEREAGRIPYAATRVIAAWTCHLRGSGVPVRDVRAAELAGLVDRPLDEAAREVLVALDPESGSDPALVATVAEQCRELVARSSERATSRGRPT